jgi:hypothetical protein
MFQQFNSNNWQSTDILCYDDIEIDCHASISISTWLLIIETEAIAENAHRMLLLTKTRDSIIKETNRDCAIARVELYPF